jgi:hypothetical protein
MTAKRKMKPYALNQGRKVSLEPKHSLSYEDNQVNEDHNCLYPYSHIRMLRKQRKLGLRLEKKATRHKLKEKLRNHEE